MGSVAYPLIGEVEAGGKTVRELEKLIAVKLWNGYLRKPRVGIEVTNYRCSIASAKLNGPAAMPMSKE